MHTKHCVKATLLIVCCVKMHMRCGCNALVLSMNSQRYRWDQDAILTYDRLCLCVCVSYRVIANNAPTRPVGNSVVTLCSVSVLLQIAHGIIHRDGVHDSVLCDIVNQMWMHHVPPILSFVVYVFFCLQPIV